MALNYVSILARDGSPLPESHGTHVMDIAAGNGQGLGIPGYAPEADLMFVEPSSKKGPVGPEVVGQSFGDSTLLLKAIKYIFDRAAGRPTVVNISLGG